MLRSRSVPAVALAVEPGACPDRQQIEAIAGQLAAGHIGATWIVSSARQATQLRELVNVLQEVCWGLRPDAATAPQQVAAEIEAAHAQGIAMATIAADGPPAADALPRWHALGVRGVVLNGHATAGVQRTAAGIWQFVESFSAPGSLGWFSKSAARRLDHHQTGLAVIRLDLSAARSARGGRRLQEFVDGLVARSVDRLQAVSLSTATGALEARCAPRPQRSILRAA